MMAQMGIGVKVFVTGAALMFLVAFLVGVDKGDRGAADASAWRGGSSDVFRGLIMRSDGALRKYTKPLVAAFLIALLSVIWLLT
jgi:hypothetical protein